MVMQVVPQDVAPLIDRSLMPQVDDKLYPDLFVFLGNNYGIIFTAGWIDANKLRLHQEVDPEKAKAIPDSILTKPILIAQDGFVLDGDHRAYRHDLDGTKAPFIRLEADFDRALKAVLDFPGTFKVPK